MKKKILNSDELSKYYKMVNTKLNNKFKDLNISPAKIVKYLKPGSENFKRFIDSDDDLKDVDNIELVLKHIINDTEAMFKDKLQKKENIDMVKKFENFNVQNKENIFDIQTSNSDRLTHEKVLADIYDVSPSYIDLKYPFLHLYEVEEKFKGIKHQVMIFSLIELSSIKENILHLYTNEILKSNFNFTELNYPFNISLNEVIDSNKLRIVLDAKIENEDVIKIICQNTKLSSKVVFKNTFTKNNSEYYLFEIISE